MYILTTLTALATLAAAGPMDPCKTVSNERVVALFAEAGQTVTVREAGGFGDVAVMGWCTYQLSDSKGDDLSVSVQIAQLEEGVSYTTCNPWGQNDGFHVIAELAEEACVQDGGSALPLFEIVVLSFRSGSRAGEVTLIWEIEDESLGPVRLTVAEKVARAWVEAIGT